LNLSNQGINSRHLVGLDILEFHQLWCALKSPHIIVRFSGSIVCKLHFIVHVLRTARGLAPTWRTQGYLLYSGALLPLSSFFRFVVLVTVHSNETLLAGS
jgi:hypothetical protein